MVHLKSLVKGSKRIGGGEWAEEWGEERQNVGKEVRVGRRALERENGNGGTAEERNREMRKRGEGGQARAGRGRGMPRIG